MVDFLILMPLSLDSLDSETGMNSLMVSLLESFKTFLYPGLNFSSAKRVHQNPETP